MALEITVRGFAEKRYAAERATVTLSAAVEGLDKQKVYADAVAIQDPILDQLTELVGRDAVTSHDSDQVRVYSQRPWGPDDARLPLTHSATVVDAVLKAQAYSDALRGGRVHAVHLADSGMLNESSASVDIPMAKMAMAVSGDAGGLVLAPRELVIRVEVDAKFITD